MAKSKAVVKVAKKEVVTIDSLVQDITVLNIELDSNLTKAKTYADLAVQYAVNMGEKLVDLKKLIPHGEWVVWADAHLPISSRTAQRYMRAYNNPVSKPAVKVIKKVEPEIGSLSFFLPTEVPDTVETDPEYDVGELTTDEIIARFKKKLASAKKELKTETRLKEEMKDQLKEALEAVDASDPKNLTPKVKKLLKNKEDLEANIRGLEQVYARVKPIREMVTQEIALLPALSIRPEVVPIISPDINALADLLDNLSEALRGITNV